MRLVDTVPEWHSSGSERRAGMKPHILKIFAWLNQVAADPDIGDFAIRVSLALAQNAHLRARAESTLGETRIYIQSTKGELRAAAETSVSLSGLMHECRASKQGVRKALKALADRGHLDVSPAYGRQATRYLLILHPIDRSRTEAVEGMAPVELDRLHDAYEAVARAAAIPASRLPPLPRHRVTTVTPSEGHSRDTVEPPKAPAPTTAAIREPTAEELEARMSATRRAALREARLRDRLRGER